MAHPSEPPAPPSREGALEPPTLRLPGRDDAPAAPEGAPIALEDAPTMPGDASEWVTSVGLTSGNWPAGQQRPGGERPSNQQRAVADRPSSQQRAVDERPSSQQRAVGERPSSQQQAVGEPPASKQGASGEGAPSDSPIRVEAPRPSSSDFVEALTPRLPRVGPANALTPTPKPPATTEVLTTKRESPAEALTTKRESPAEALTTKREPSAETLTAKREPTSTEAPSTKRQLLAAEAPSTKRQLLAAEATASSLPSEARTVAPRPPGGAAEVQGVSAAFDHRPAAPSIEELEERRLRMKAQRTSIAKDLVQITAFALTGIWVFFTFVWKEQIQPRYAESSASVRVTATKEGERDGLLAVRIHAHVENPSKSPVRVVAASYVIFGNRVELTPPPEPQASPEPAPAVSAIAGKPFWAYGDPGVRERDGQLVENVGVSYDAALRDNAGPPLPTVLPGASFDLEYICHVAKSRWDVLKVDAGFVLLNTAQADAVAPGWVGPRRQGEITVHAPSESCTSETGGRCPLLYASDHAELSLWDEATTPSAPRRPPPNPPEP